MYKQVSIFSLGILFLVAVTQSAQWSYNNNDELALEYQYKPINRRDALNLHRIWKRSGGFTNEQSQFQKEMLQTHNSYRSRHCASRLQLDDKLSRSAQNYAEYLASTETFQHSGTQGVGENIWMIGSSDEISNVNGHQPTDKWYNEVGKYNYDQGGFSLETGHFTQLVWKGTKKMGVGIAYNSDHRKAYVVARYSPPGNYEGQYKQNVLPPHC